MNIRPGIRRSLAVSAVVAATLGVVGLSPTSAAQTDCPQPFPAYYAATSIRTAEPQLAPDHPVDPPWPLIGDDVPWGVGPHRSVADLVVDTDGDGEPDVVTDEMVLVRQGDAEEMHHEVRLDRGDGTVTLRLPVVQFDMGSHVAPAGDLDGDGRGELLIDRFVVPGSVPLGSHLVADVAVELPGNRVLPAGDGVGDASYDLLVGSGGGAGARTHLVDGRTVVKSGPGSRLTDLGPVTLPGVPASVFDVGSGSPAYAAVSDGLVTVLHGSDVVRYAGPVTADIDVSVGVGSHGGRRYLAAISFSGPHVTGSWWDLDDPCRQLPPNDTAAPPTTGEAGCLCAPPMPGRPPAPPATPVRAAAAYTG